LVEVMAMAVAAEDSAVVVVVKGRESSWIYIF
jgi:hypothetical protein